MKLSASLRLCGLFLFPIFCFSNCFSQKLYIPRNIQKAYSKETRNENGMPGKNYWQNSGNYNIDVSFDPEKRLVSGKATIEYFNNSPDSLDGLIFKLAPNLYK